MTDDESSIFKKYIADSLKKERQLPAEIKPRRPAYEPTRRTVDPKTFILDVLTSGPAPTKSVLQRGAERGLTRKQIWHARKRLKIVAFKDLGKNGCWFLALPNHVR